MKIDIRCVCGNHEQDSVVLKDKLDWKDALVVRQALRLLYDDEPNPTSAQVLACLSGVYLSISIESWTLQERDERGKLQPIPVRNEQIERFIVPDYDIATTITDACDALYTEAVVLPLVQKASTSSPATPTDESTSPPTDTSSTPPKRSKRSSISTIPTAVTEATSPSLDGDSNLSPSSASAA